MEHMVNSCEHAGALKLDKVVVRRALWRKILGQLPPLATGGEHVQNAILQDRLALHQRLETEITAIEHERSNALVDCAGPCPTHMKPREVWPTVERPPIPTDKRKPAWRRACLAYQEWRVAGGRRHPPLQPRRLCCRFLGA